MADDDRKRAFISYSVKDRDVANEMRNRLQAEELDIWIDTAAIQPGKHISSAIKDGLNASDYFILLISEHSNRSEWVKREISLAFELSRSAGLTVVPVLLQDVEVPFEFRGLLYIDARQSFRAGLDKLVEFFRSQLSRISTLEKRVMRRKSLDDRIVMLNRCQDILRDLSLGNLRFHLTKRLTLNDVKVLWFDVFGAKMDDEVQVLTLAQCCVELLDRSRREELLAELIDTICRNHPRLSTLVA